MKNLKVGDIILVEEVWEDEAGNYHDENAKILGIEEDGELTLEWICEKEISELLKERDGYYAKDFCKM